MLIRKLGPIEWKLDKRVLSRTTNFGQYNNWSIAVDEFRDNTGTIVEKRFVVWNDLVQYIINKRRGKDKGFERYW